MSKIKAPVEPADNECRILVADDDPYLLDLMQAKLEDERTTVVCAENGIAAQSLLKEQDFDLAIIDLGMPQLDGFELIHKGFIAATAETEFAYRFLVRQEAGDFPDGRSQTIRVLLGP